MSPIITSTSFQKDETRRVFPVRWHGCVIMTPMPGKDWAVDYRESSRRLAEYRRQIAALRDKMRDIRAVAEPEEVPDYAFTNSNGSLRLSELFGAKPDLIVIHNMGASCPHCTLWADGFNGIHDHLENHAAF